MATQLNFAQQMDAVLKTLDGTRPRFCSTPAAAPAPAPCWNSCASILRSRCFTITPTPGLPEEYHRRGEELKKFVAQPILWG